MPDQKWNTDHSEKSSELAELPNVVALFSEAAQNYSDEIAVVSPHNELTYAELASEVSTVARLLENRGVRFGDTVAVEQSSHSGAVAALLGVLSAGGVVLPLDPMLTEARREAALSGADTAAIVTADRDGWAIHARADRLTATGSPRSAPVHQPDSQTSGVPVPAELAYVVFTSGSTGRPKGVLGRHVGLAHFVQWQRDAFGIGPGDRFAQLTSWAFDVALRDILTPLVSGATVYLPDSRSLDTARVAAFLESHRITALHTVPSLARRWIDRWPDQPLELLRHTFFAGEQLDGELVSQWRNRVAPETRVINLYGPTETTLAKFWFEVPKNPQPGPQPVGRPLPGTELLFDGRGEVIIGTPYRSAGYLNGESAFRPNTVSGGAGDSSDLVYSTGDLGYLEDGLLRLSGRTDDQVKVNGVRLRLGDVENALATVPGVLQAGVVDVLDEHGTLVLVGYVQVGQEEGSSRTSVTQSALRQAVADGLSTAAIPTSLLLVTSLALLPSGKLDRAALRERAFVLRSPSEGELLPDSVGSERGTTTSAVTEVCARVLEVTPRVPNVDLFELGLDSMAAVEIAVQLEDVFGVAVPLGLVYETPTVAEIAEWIDDALSAEAIVP